MLIMQEGVLWEGAASIGDPVICVKKRVIKEWGEDDGVFYTIVVLKNWKL